MNSFFQKKGTLLLLSPHLLRHCHELMILTRHYFLTVEVYNNEIMYVKGDLLVRGRILNGKLREGFEETTPVLEYFGKKGQVYFLGISALFLRIRLIEVKCNPK